MLPSVNAFYSYFYVGFFVVFFYFILLFFHFYFHGFKFNWNYGTISQMLSALQVSVLFVFFHTLERKLFSFYKLIW